MQTTGTGSSLEKRESALKNVFNYDDFFHVTVPRYRTGNPPDSCVKVCRISRSESTSKRFVAHFVLLWYDCGLCDCNYSTTSATVTQIRTR